ncbi:hypothetical protein DL98DRAFT_607426 [Cadophora sp. DSE1049]|nr:hypothetical protein DL98DRAFT_607426 [Cadophora sp. DSE1049]
MGFHVKFTRTVMGTARFDIWRGPQGILGLVSKLRSCFPVIWFFSGSMCLKPQHQLPQLVEDMHQHLNKRIRTSSSHRVHGFPSKSLSNSENNTKTFHPFSRLPPELQLSIWCFALPRYRIIQPILDRGGHDHVFPVCRNPRPPPPQDPSILQVNQQSRSEAQRFFHPRALDPYSSSTSNLIAISYPSPRPCRYISPRFDILYLDSLLDFELGGHCFRNVLARCDSVDEMLGCQNLALRLRDAPYMVERFFMWLVVWIWWFPRVRKVWVVVDDVMDDWHLMKVEKKIRMASWRAEQWMRGRKEELEELEKFGGGWREWMVPDLEVVTRELFEGVWWEGVRRSAWPVDGRLKAVEAIEGGFCKAEILKVEQSNTHGRLIERRNWWDVVMG